VFVFHLTDAGNKMAGFRTNLIWVTALTLSATAWIGAWTAGLVLGTSQWPRPYELFGAGFVITMCFAYGCIRHMAGQQRAAQSFFNALSCLDSRDITESMATANLPALARSNPWFGAAERLYEKYGSAAQRAQTAEHSKAAIEVRAQRMRTELEQIKVILDYLHEPVVAIDNFDEVILSNVAAQKLFGFEITEGSSRAVGSLIRSEKILEMLIDTRRRKTPTQRLGEVELGSTDLRTYSVGTASMPCTGACANDETRAHGAVAVLRDISAHKAAQKRNAEFVSAVSHEMKTPLAGIKAYVELLADGDAEDEETREEFLNVINSQTDRLQRLIDNMLNLARIEAGVVNVSKQARSLNEVLEEAYNVVCPSAEAKNIQLNNDLSPMYLGVLVDRDMILQAAINLLSNAIKYTPEGGRVTLRSRTADNEIVFEVEDTGVGLSEEDKYKVFEKFYRVKKDRKMAQGTGLGLPLAKHIVEDVHAGKLTVDSVLEKGSTFRVTLPAAGQMSMSLVGTN